MVADLTMHTGKLRRLSWSEASSCLMFDVSMECCVDTFHTRYPPTATIRSTPKPRAQGRLPRLDRGVGGKEMVHPFARFQSCSALVFGTY